MKNIRTFKQFINENSKELTNEGVLDNIRNAIGVQSNNVISAREKEYETELVDIKTKLNKLVEQGAKVLVTANGIAQPYNDESLKALKNDAIKNKYRGKLTLIPSKTKKDTIYLQYKEGTFILQDVGTAARSQIDNKK